jgi:hypothetical protein
VRDLSQEETDDKVKGEAERAGGPQQKKNNGVLFSKDKEKIMRMYVTIMCVALLALVGAGTAQADSATWDVATVHGYDQFTIGTGGTSLHYNEQGWTDYGWSENNGSAPGTMATTTAGPHAPSTEIRSGMRTFAATDVAAGQALDSLKLEFDYKTALGYTTINFFMTDGAGHYGIFAPTSKGLASVGKISVIDDTWTHMTIDLTDPTISTAAVAAVYEHNGFVNNYDQPFTTMTWGDIKDYTIAGMYNYQRSPEGGWGAWGSMFTPINQAGNATVVNGYGLALIWGDTANSSNSYGSQQREIRNVDISFEGVTYAGTFENAQVPEPISMVMLGCLGAGMAAARKLRRRK